MKKVVLSLCAVLFLAISCKKDSSDNPPAINTDNLSGNYKVNAINLKEGSISVDILSQLDTCLKDDIITLKKDNTYTWPDGGMKCSPTADQNGSWSLQGTNKFIWDNVTYDLNSFDGKLLSISRTGIDTFQALFNSGQPFTLTYQFKKQ